MKINPSVAGLDQGKSTGAASGDRSTKAAAPSGAGSPQADTIQLSALSAQLHALEATLSTGAEFDRNKVEAIKQAIRDGTLTVNPEVVADRMLAGTLALLGKTDR